MAQNSSCWALLYKDLCPGSDLRFGISWENSHTANTEISTKGYSCGHVPLETSLEKVTFTKHLQKDNLSYGLMNKGSRIFLPWGNPRPFFWQEEANSQVVAWAGWQDSCCWPSYWRKTIVFSGVQKPEHQQEGKLKGIGLHRLMALVLSWRDGTGLCSQDYSHLQL